MPFYYVAGLVISLGACCIPVLIVVLLLQGFQSYLGAVIGG